MGQNLIICPVVLPDVVDATIALRDALDAVAAALYVVLGIGLNNLFF